MLTMHHVIQTPGTEPFDFFFFFTSVYSRNITKMMRTHQREQTNKQVNQSTSLKQFTGFTQLHTAGSLMTRVNTDLQKLDMKCWFGVGGGVGTPACQSPMLSQSSCIEFFRQSRKTIKWRKGRKENPTVTIAPVHNQILKRTRASKSQSCRYARNGPLQDLVISIKA